jgi:hypothetical protein
MSLILKMKTSAESGLGSGNKNYSNLLIIKNLTERVGFYYLRRLQVTMNTTLSRDKSLRCL